MTIGTLLRDARRAGFDLTPVGEGLDVEGFTDAHAGMIAMLAANKHAVCNVLILEQRLDHGWELCDAATDPAEYQRLEDHWIRLLHAYERACDEETAPMPMSLSHPSRLIMAAVAVQ